MEVIKLIEERRKSGREIARDFGVTEGAIRKIKNEKESMKLRIQESSEAAVIASSTKPNKVSYNKCNCLIKAKLVPKYTHVTKIMKLVFTLEQVVNGDFVRTYTWCVLN